jgi:magnesium transporter
MDNKFPIEMNFPTTHQSHSSRLDYFYHRPGTHPGKLNLRENLPASDIIVIDYNSSRLEQVGILEIEAIADYLIANNISWIDVLGLGNLSMWSSLTKIFNFHPLLVEDIVNVPQRPKVEQHEQHLLIITWMVILKPERQTFVREQVSFVLGDGYLLSVQEEPEDDCFHGVRDRLENPKSTIRQQKADYLLYCLLDSIIDGFFPVLEYYGEIIEELEDEVIRNPAPATLQRIYQVRRELLNLRRAIWPQRDTINNLIRDESELISHEVHIYLRDCYDHTVQVMDMVETYRELATGLMDVYLSSVSNKMNEVMKFLTVISVTFIPITFIAGVFGMNFNTEKSPFNMPELSWYWGYFACLALMAIVGGGSLYYFWQRGWLTRPPKNF